MAVQLTRKQRVLRCVTWQPCDRVPIHSPIDFDPDAWREGRLAAWQDHPNYRRVAEVVAEHCTFPGRYRSAGNLFSRAHMLIPDHYVERTREERGDCTFLRTIIHTPRGDLQALQRTDRNVRTTWMLEPLVKTEADAEAILSVPFEENLPDPEPFERERRAWGERGLIELGVSTPLVCVSHIMHFDQFLEWTASNRPLIERMIGAVFERIHVRLEHLLKAGVIECVWLGGSEQATPPMMSRRFYEDLVVRYDGRLIELAKRHGTLVHVHCHGKIGGILDLMLEMGVDMTDPVEPPPDGDIDFTEAKRRCRRRMVLMGNIELRHLEYCTRGEVDEMVRRAICEGGKSGMMLYPSAVPLTWMSDRVSENCLQYMKSALKYGQI